MKWALLAMGVVVSSCASFEAAAQQPLGQMSRERISRRSCLPPGRLSAMAACKPTGLLAAQPQRIDSSIFG